MKTEDIEVLIGIFDEVVWKDNSIAFKVSHMEYEIFKSGRIEVQGVKGELSKEQFDEIIIVRNLLSEK